MAEVFLPNRQRGIALHFGALLLNLSAAGFLAILTLTQIIRGFFFLYLVITIALLIPLPIVTFRLFALLRAKYTIHRDGVAIQWGLTTEQIPMNHIEWVRLASDLAYTLPLPGFCVPGAVLGTRIHHDLGPIEFIASTTHPLVLIATPEKILAISPNKPQVFIETFQRNMELGSIEPIQAMTSRADFLVSSLMKDKIARPLILSSLFLSLGLLIAVSFIIPTRQTIPLGFNPIGQSAEASPSERLLLLPLLSLIMLTADISLGAYLYRRPGYRLAAYFAFASSLILPVSFIGILVFLIL